MGCDIHVMLEKQNKNTKEWERVLLYRGPVENPEVVDPFNGRNYELFSILAGVRGWQEPLIDPRGLPQDMSDSSKKEIDWWEGGYHTPTWYDMYELITFVERYRDKEGYGCLTDFVQNLNVYFEFVLLYYWAEYVKPNQYRAIIFFDN